MTRRVISRESEQSPEDEGEMKEGNLLSVVARSDNMSSVDVSRGVVSTSEESSKEDETDSEVNEGKSFMMAMVDGLRSNAMTSIDASCTGVSRSQRTSKVLHDADGEAWISGQRSKLKEDEKAKEGRLPLPLTVKKVRSNDGSSPWSHSALCSNSCDTSTVTSDKTSKEEEEERSERSAAVPRSIDSSASRRQLGELSMQDMPSADTEDEIGNGTEVGHVAEEVAFEGLTSFDAETRTPTTLDSESIEASPTIRDNMENTVALQTSKTFANIEV